jgi:hypothetical protein
MNFSSVIPNWLKPKAKGQTHIMTPAPRSASGVLRSGKWVYAPEFSLPGIVIGVTQFPYVTVMLTNEKGENFRQENFSVEKIRIARLSEIPEPRRPAPNLGAELGYF